jgi:16S rRNA (guanine(527)-N(7))-methyltransferase RsmG
MEKKNNSKKSGNMSIINDYLIEVNCAHEKSINFNKDILLRFSEDYLNIVQNWNLIHNIVSRKNNDIDVTINILDSLMGTFLGELPDEIYDVGAGGGFPSLPLAKFYPEKNFHLIEANRKKCSFLRFAKSRLDLKNVSIINKRIENCPLLNFAITKAAFSPATMHYLTNSIISGGIIVLWLSEKTRDDFVQTMKNLGFVCIGEYAYKLSGKEQRVILKCKKL